MDFWGAALGISICLTTLIAVICFQLHGNHSPLHISINSLNEMIVNTTIIAKI